MFELAKSEFYRYQKWACLWALVVLGVFLFSLRYQPFLYPDQAKSALNNLLMLGGSFMFGALQIVLHRRKNHWTFLIHRPLPSSGICNAILLAGAAVILIAVGAPWLVMVAGTDVFGSSLVEFRHYSYIVYLCLTALMSYQLGVLIVLNASRGIVLLVGLLVLVLAPKADSHLAQFAPVIVFNGMLYYLNKLSFKPDLSTYLRGPIAQSLLAVPMSFNLVYLLILSTVVFYHGPKWALGTHPDTNPVDGSLSYTYSLNKDELVYYTLENAKVFAPDLANSIRLQADESNYHWIAASVRSHPRSHQLHLDDTSYQLVDEKNNINYQFSHKHMVLLGKHALTGEPAGVIGQDGFYRSLSEFKQNKESAVFDRVPYLIENRYAAFGNTLLSINFEDQSVSERFRLRDNEYLQNMPYYMREGGFISLFTNQRIILFDSQRFAYEYETLAPNFAFDLPDTIELTNILGFELADGFAFIIKDKGHYSGVGAKTHLIHVDYAQNETLVASREYTVNRHPNWIEEIDYMLSPLLYVMRAEIMNALDEALAIPSDTSEMTVNLQAVIVHVISLILLIILGRKHELNKAQWATWIVLVSSLSFPALLSFVLLHPFKGVYFKKPQRLLSAKPQAV
ncbi:hypothetical protein [Glaciecola sp. KUL10]|uniref:hypothetical protein n=1 Tax=Glaciecola sp. (strain KUL10) TaxID=2161813 RepID=UPI000D78443D|nr:hypothetical protein [Glaciecola sp. KUL10]GBL04807.1 hypothetical protein KUL10_21210 [Glaciecola sp. KUL10]